MKKGTKSSFAGTLLSSLSIMLGEIVIPIMLTIYIIYIYIYIYINIEFTVYCNKIRSCKWNLISEEVAQSVITWVRLDFVLLG